MSAMSLSNCRQPRPQRPCASKLVASARCTKVACNSEAGDSAGSLKLTLAQLTERRVLDVLDVLDHSSPAASAETLCLEAGGLGGTREAIAIIYYIVCKGNTNNILRHRGIQV